MTETAIRRNRLGKRTRYVLVIGLTVILLSALPVVTASFHEFRASRAPSNFDVSPNSIGASSLGEPIPLPDNRSSESSPSADAGGPTELSYDASVKLETTKPAETIERVAQEIRDAGGSVVSLNVRTNGDETAQANFRVPAENLTPLFNKVSEMGTAKSKNLSAHDVGPSRRGATERLTAAQAEVDRLIEELRTADGVQQSFVQRQLNQARARVVAAQTELENVDRKVTYASLAVYIDTTAAGLTDRNGTDAFGHAASKGWDATVAVVSVAFSVVGFVLPLLVALALLVLLAGVSLRITRRLWTLAKPLFR